MEDLYVSEYIPLFKKQERDIKQLWEENMDEDIRLRKHLLFQYSKDNKCNIISICDYLIGTLKNCCCIEFLTGWKIYSKIDDIATSIYFVAIKNGWKADLEDKRIFDRVEQIVKEKEEYAAGEYDGEDFCFYLYRISTSVVKNDIECLERFRKELLKEQNSKRESTDINVDNESNEELKKYVFNDSIESFLRCEQWLKTAKYIDENNSWLGRRTKAVLVQFILLLKDNKYFRRSIDEQSDANDKEYNRKLREYFEKRYSVPGGLKKQFEKNQIDKIKATIKTNLEDCPIKKQS